jgi:hypothetical protein
MSKIYLKRITDNPDIFDPCDGCYFFDRDCSGIKDYKDCIYLGFHYEQIFPEVK